ncbi:MAG: peptidylprolyl isomerase [Defluviitaleaceae bacterium]|nr:peptidylprolyl isomerase [Defluviitaleaceae bacterium]
MKKFTKMILAAATVGCIAFFTACAEANGDDDTNYTFGVAGTAGNNENDVAERLLQPINPWTERGVVVGTVYGRNIYEGEVGVFINQALDFLAWDYFEMFGDFDLDFERQFDDERTFGDAVREEAVRFAAFTKIFEDLANQMGITLGEEDYLRTQEYHEFLLTQMNPEELKHALSHDRIHGMDHLLHLYLSQIRLEHMVDYLIDNPDRFEYFGFNNYLPEEPVNATTLATELLERARAGEDFGSLIVTYGQDPGMASNPNGYTFVSGTMVPEFEEATLQLEIGEISDLVPSQFGYHIILRVEPDPDNIMGRLPNEGEELMGAKHILVTATETQTLEDRKVEAIFRGLEERTQAAELVFLPALSRIGLDDCC